MDQQHDALQPIVLASSLHETIWGGQHLATVANKRLPAGVRIGESWETEIACVAQNQPYTGQTLGALVTRYGAALIGTQAIAIFGQRFPLLTKFIDAQQPLSVQVHPDDAYAAAHEQGKLGKTEVWYVLRAEPGAQLVYGLAQRSSEAEVEAAITGNRLEALLHSVEAHAGDVFFVQAGTVHAIGAGIVLYEIQEYSDVTYRLYDYGRLQANGQPRELHIARGLEVMDYAPPAHVRTPTVTQTTGDETRTILVGCEYFVAEDLRVKPSVHSATDGSSCHILTVLEGACALRAAETALHLGTGDTAVVPASCGVYSLSAIAAGNAPRVLRAYVPTADDASLRAWQAAHSATMRG